MALSQWGYSHQIGAGAPFRRGLQVEIASSFHPWFQPEETYPRP
ncbi:MAG TPA: hypothetical protein P5270_06925 [Victivallales bacterium]|nr:hypothetical protein [Victivallales bacterium]HPO91396.1 hypothetical protein [Victivallales bacterium]HRR29080.1 hypothetical protein [Victivallales bacterium]